MPGCPCLDGALSPVAAALHQSGGTSLYRSHTIVQESVKVFCLAGRNGSAYRATWSNVDAQIAKLEAFHLRNTSQDVFMRDNAVSHQRIEATHSSQASSGLYMQIREYQVDVYAGVAHSYVGHVHSEHSVDAFPGDVTVGDEPVFGMQRACAGDHVKGVNSTSESRHFDVGEAFPGSDGVTEACRDARHSGSGMQHVDMEMEDHNARIKHLAEGFTTKNEGVSSCAQIAGSTSSLAYEQGVRNENENGGEDGRKPSMAGVGVELSMSTSTTPRKVAAVRVPIYRPPRYLQTSLTSSICYLESLGVDCAKLFQDEPRLRAYTVKQIKAWVSGLEGYGVEWKDIGKIFNMSPKVLLLDPQKDLEVITSFLLQEVGLSLSDLPKVMRRSPRVLVADLNTQLRPTVSFLRTLGYGRINHVIALNTNLLTYGVESRLIPRLRLFESWGFTYREAAAVAVRFPAIFNYSAIDNLQCKYDYLVHEIGGGKKDLLAFPQYFGYSLDTKIRPRHQCIAKLNVCLSIQAMLTLSDAEFYSKFVDGGGMSARVDEVCRWKRGASLYESIEAKLHECNKELLLSASFENPEARVLISV